MTVTSETEATGAEYCGVFLIAMATLMLEILLTRIFSVTLFAHLAFIAVSIAMFGMTLGACLVYLFPGWFATSRAGLNLTIGSTFFGLSAVWTIDTHLRFAGTRAPNLITSPLSELAFAYSLSAVPFVFSGIVITILLTSFPRQLGRLYAADLGGAALGCLVLISLFDWVGGPRAVLIVGGFAMVAALGFTLKPGQRWGLAARALILVAFGLTFPLAVGRGVRELGYDKETGHVPVLFEKWNSYSRIAVKNPALEPPFGWGLSTTFAGTALLRQLRLNIDSSAETVMTEFRGDLSVLEHLKYDVTNIAHYLVDKGRVFVIGAGGGRDILSALVFKQEQVVAAEMNKAIIDAVNGPFGDITGHLDAHPGVRFVNDEARSYLTRLPDRFDLIQISLIDTWAATAAGAFVLSENTLYTREAWTMFVSKLTDDGILSVSRWYRRAAPGEMYKATALASDTLRRLGVENPRSHLMIVAAQPKPGEPRNAPVVATLLLKKTAFTEAEVITIEEVAKRLDFNVPISAHPSTDGGFVALTSSRAMDRFIADFSEDLSPPTDNRPFFWMMKPGLVEGLLAFVSVLTLLFIVVPVLLRAQPKVFVDHFGLTVAFGGIGFGFMLVEIAQMQRLTLLLGHPAFSLSVVLFGLLVSSGLGSFASQRSPSLLTTAFVGRRLAALCTVLVILGVATAPAVHAFQGMSTPVRIAVALSLLAPAGFFMGMAFPMAMGLASVRRPSLAPWFWAVNGATSVTASVLAVLISSRWGIAATWWAGVVCYIVAGAAILAAARTASAAAIQRVA